MLLKLWKSTRHRERMWLDKYDERKQILNWVDLRFNNILQNFTEACPRKYDLLVSFNSRMQRCEVLSNRDCGKVVRPYSK